VARFDLRRPCCRTAERTWLNGARVVRVGDARGLPHPRRQGSPKVIAQLPGTVHSHAVLAPCLVCERGEPAVRPIDHVDAPVVAVRVVCHLPCHPWTSVAGSPGHPARARNRKPCAMSVLVTRCQLTPGPCHAEGRGFESLHPLKQSPAQAGFSVSRMAAEPARTGAGQHLGQHSPSAAHRAA
jgi:hypothetical protein